VALGMAFLLLAWGVTWPHYTSDASAVKRHA
jgi:hypothetical protein